MCGIVGYVGKEQTLPIILDGLGRLEYRGYDSAGVAVVTENGLVVRRSEGKLINLVRKTQAEPMEGTIGIGHTRWATHGAPVERNAHPHRSGDIVLAHNGIIENFNELRQELSARGRKFVSDTDTEIVAHLVDEALHNGAHGDMLVAVRHALTRVRGAWALVILNAKQPDRIIVARNASPLVVGIGDGEAFVASDVPAILSHTNRMVYLDDGDVGELTREGVRFFDTEGNPVERTVKTINWSPAMAEKGGHKHFMHKEIFEQPRALIDTMRGRLRPEEGDVFIDGFGLDNDAIRSLERGTIVACGTSWHSALVGKFLFEKLARFPIEVDLASEYRYREPIVKPGSLLMAVSQSGETADTLAAIKEGRRKGAHVLSVVNVVESSIARESDNVFYTHAGPEIGVASTKAFTTQIANLAMLAVRFGRARGTLTAEQGRVLIDGMMAAPGLIEQVLLQEDRIRYISEKYARASNCLYLGRGINYPVALEGALKLKEISYIHAEGYPAGEMKHGPIALIDETMPVVFIATQNSAYEKTLSNIQEVRARGGKVIAIATNGDDRIWDFAADVITVPALPEHIEPLITTIPLQLIAYHIADHNGTDVDQPRNLAKSVTVE